MIGLHDSNQSLALARSMRPQLVFLPWLIYSSVIINNRGLDNYLIALGMIILIASYGIVTIHNDIADAHTDKLNKRKDIPLTTSAVTINDLSTFLVSLIIVSVATSLLIGNNVLLWLGVYCLLGWLYSGPALLKNKGYYALLTLGLCYGVMPWLLGFIAIGRWPDTSELIIILSSFIFTFGIISLKDFKDVKGDRATGKNTILVLKGPCFTQKLIVSFTSIAYLIAISLATYRLHLSFILIGFALLGINIYLLSRTIMLHSAKRRARNGKIARVIFFLYLLIYLLLL